MLANLWSFSIKKSKKTVDATQGTAAIETALIAPVFFLVFMGIFEIGMMMTVKAALETSILQVSRFGRTGDLGQAKATALALADQYTFGLVDTSKMVLTVNSAPTFTGLPSLSSQAATGGNYLPGAGNQFALYTLSYKWNFFTPLVGNALGKPLGTTLISSTIVQNEPF